MKALDILVVDDVLSNLDVLDQFLSQMGHRVITANSGLQAVEMFRTHRPELVLMDVMLPDISGLEATRRIRALAGERWVPILYVSALHEREQVVQGLAAGGGRLSRQARRSRLAGCQDPGHAAHCRHAVTAGGRFA